MGKVRKRGDSAERVGHEIFTEEMNCQGCDVESVGGGCGRS